VTWGDDRFYDSATGIIWEVEARAAATAFSWSDFLFGATIRSIGQSVSGEMKLSSQRNTYFGFMVGLLIPFGVQAEPSP
jgi:hypothetical protein